MAKRQTRIKDIAVRAGVSAGTVDRVLHNRGEVSTTTRNKILSIIEKFQYQPNVLASNLASRKKIRFAVFIPAGGPLNPFWDAPLQGIKRAAEELSPYGVETDIYTFTTSNTQSFREKANQLLTNPPDGILMAPIFYQESQRFLKECAAGKLPILFIDTQTDYPYSIQFIGQNACQSGHVAARLLTIGQAENANYLVFNIIGDKDQLNHFSERVNGFSDYFKTKKLPAIIHLFDIESGMKQIRQILTNTLKEKDIHGIFVSGSKVYEVAQVIQELKINRIRLIGYDLVEENIHFLNDEIIDFLLCQEPEEQGYLGMQTLYASLVQHIPTEPQRHTAIDIITRENIADYLRGK